jgi:hypothetical protein
MRCFRFLVLATVATAGVLLAPEFASAHDLRAKVTVADEVKVLAYFEEEDAPAQFAEVSVMNAEGVAVLTGKTDEYGVWTFALPKPAAYSLKVESAGHVATVPFLIEGEPAAGPVVYTGWRMNKALGLTIGLVVLLGISAASWFLRHRRRG